MRQILFLDDDGERTVDFGTCHPSDNVFVFNTADQIISYLGALDDLSIFDEIHLDHDLVGIWNDPNHKNTGSEVVRNILSLGDKVSKNTQFFVHSWNATAAIEHMVRPLAKAGFKVLYRPYGVMLSLENWETIDRFCRGTKALPNKSIWEDIF